MSETDHAFIVGSFYFIRTIIEKSYICEGYQKNRIDLHNLDQKDIVMEKVDETELRSFEITSGYFMNPPIKKNVCLILNSYSLVPLFISAYFLFHLITFKNLLEEAAIAFKVYRC